MNGKIGLVLLIVFTVVFSGFFFFNKTFTDISEEKFYSQEFDLSKKKILIYGSSHLIQLNSTHIKEEVSKISDKHVVFNMAENGDTPQRRSLNIDKDLHLEPEIIVYGIGFRDFSSLKKENLETEFRFVDLIPFDTTELETLNPKLTTLEVLRSAAIELITKNKNSNVPYPNTPVFSERVQDIIIESNELNNNLERFEDFSIPTENNEQVEYFRTIIETMTENKIKVIILVTPHHSTVLEKIPQIEMKNFYEILSIIEDKFDVKIYDYSNKYEGLSIWRDATHIAFNEKVIIFSDDVAQIIIKEIKKYCYLIP